MAVRMKQHRKGQHSQRWYARTQHFVAHLHRNRTEAHIVEQRLLASEGAEENSVSDKRLLKVEGPMPEIIKQEIHHCKPGRR